MLSWLADDEEKSRGEEQMQSGSRLWAWVLGGAARKRLEAGRGETETSSRRTKQAAAAEEGKRPATNKGNKNAARGDPGTRSADVVVDVVLDSSRRCEHR